MSKLRFLYGVYEEENENLSKIEEIGNYRVEEQIGWGVIE